MVLSSSVTNDTSVQPAGPGDGEVAADIQGRPVGLDLGLPVVAVRVRFPFTVVRTSVAGAPVLRSNPANEPAANRTFPPTVTCPSRLSK